jgi:hypothetical protein
MLKGGVSGPHGGPASAPNAKTGAANAATPSVTDGSERMPLRLHRSSSRTRWIAAISAAIGHLTYFELARYEALRNAALTAPARLRTPSLS